MGRILYLITDATNGLIALGSVALDAPSLLVGNVSPVTSYSLPVGVGVRLHA